MQATPQKPVQLIPVAPRFLDATTQIPAVSGQQTGAPVEGEAPLARGGPGGGRSAPRAFPSLVASSRCRAGVPREDPRVSTASSFYPLPLNGHRYPQPSPNLGSTWCGQGAPLGPLVKKDPHSPGLLGIRPPALNTQPRTRCGVGSIPGRMVGSLGAPRAQGPRGAPVQADPRPAPWLGSGLHLPLEPTI